MKIYRITIYNNVSKKKRRINVGAWSITEIADGMKGRLHSIEEEIIRIVRWDNR